MSRMSSSEIVSYFGKSPQKSSRRFSSDRFSSDQTMSKFFSSKNFTNTTNYTTSTKYIRKKKSLLDLYKDTQERFSSLRTISKINSGIERKCLYNCVNPKEINDPLYDTDIIEDDTDILNHSLILQRQGFNVALLNISNDKSTYSFNSSSLSQEECLMIRTTYQPQNFDEGNIGVYSPDIYVLKNNKFELEEKDDCYYINVATLPFCETKEDIRTFLRICNINKIDCPMIGYDFSDKVYKYLWKVLDEYEFVGMFKKIFISKKST